MINEQNILDALKIIIDPDLKRDIVSLGFVQNIKIEESTVSFDIALTTPACPIKQEFEDKARELVLNLEGIKTVNINMTTLKRSNASFAQPKESPLGKIKSIIAVSSCKGGVGKSTLACQTALELAQRGHKVGLVDCDIHGPSIPTLLNISNEKVVSNENNKIVPIEKHGLKIMSFGFLLGDAPAIMRGPIVTRYIQQILLATEWGELDYLFIDMPPGTSDVHITITQTIRLSGAIIVTTPHTLSLIDVARGILMFEKVNVPILGIVENMSYFQAPDSNEKHYVFGKSSQESLNKQFGVNTLAEIPVLPQMTKSIDQYIANEYIMNIVDQAIRNLGKLSIEQKTTPRVYCDEKNIKISWEDGKELVVSNFDLRLNSQDALSVNEVTGEKILKAEDIREDIKAKKVTPLGNYALGIEWNDGHNAGIYSYKLIEELATSPN